MPTSVGMVVMRIVVELSREPGTQSRVFQQPASACDVHQKEMVLNGDLTQPVKRVVRRTLLPTGRLMGQYTLLDHLVGALYEGLRNREAEGLGGLQVDHQLEPAGLLHGEVTGPGAFQDLVHVDGRATE